MTPFTVPFRGTGLELLLSREDCARIAQEAARAAAGGWGYLVTVRGPEGVLVLPEATSRELVAAVRRHLGVRQAG